MGQNNPRDFSVFFSSSLAENGTNKLKTYNTLKNIYIVGGNVKMSSKHRMRKQLILGAWDGI